MLRTGADPRSRPLDLDAKGSAPVRNIQIEPKLTKQKCQFVCYGQVQTLWRAAARNIQIQHNLTKQKYRFVCYGQMQTLWRADPTACFTPWGI